MITIYYTIGILINLGALAATQRKQTTAAQTLIFLWLACSLIFLLSRPGHFPTWRIVIPALGAIYGLLYAKNLVRLQHGHKTPVARQPFLSVNTQMMCNAGLAILCGVGLAAQQGIF